MFMIYLNRTLHASSFNNSLSSSERNLYLHLAVAILQKRNHNELSLFL